MAARTLRRYDLPAARVRAATERRLAGDWRGACSALRLTVDGEVDASPEFTDDLRHLAPELLRWHLLGADLEPVTRPQLELARYGDRSLVVRVRREPAGPARIMLLVRTLEPELRLRLTAIPPLPARLPRCLWDARCAAGLRAFLGGGDRTPWFHRDGRPVAPADLPDGPPPEDDPAAHVEWVDRLAREDPVAAWRAAGVRLGDRAHDLLTTTPWSGPPLLLHRIVPAAWDLLVTAPGRLPFGTAVVAELERPAVQLAVTMRPEAAPVLRVGDGRYFRYTPLLPTPLVGRPWYLDALRSGELTPSALPPLVRTALFPDRPDEPYGPMPGVRVPERIHVQCFRARHHVGWRDGELRLLSHRDPDEVRRERLLEALGDAPVGCFEVERAWERRTGRLPEPMRTVARHLYLAACHGDVAELTRLLDAGVDPRGVRGPAGRSLLHVANQIGDRAVVRRLVDAGLDPDRADNHGHRPRNWRGLRDLRPGR